MENQAKSKHKAKIGPFGLTTPESLFAHALTGILANEKYVPPKRALVGLGMQTDAILFSSPTSGIWGGGGADRLSRKDFSEVLEKGPHIRMLTRCLQQAES